jgi:hypothetical protein
MNVIKNKIWFIRTSFSDIKSGREQQENIEILSNEKKMDDTTSKCQSNDKIFWISMRFFSAYSLSISIIEKKMIRFIYTKVYL